MRNQENIIFDRAQEVNRQQDRQIKELTAEKATFVSLLVDVCRKILSHNASIKAGTTSLLSEDILWSSMNQYELMELINASTDQLSSLLALFSLAMRAKANMIHLQKDSNSLEEIFIHVNRQLKSRYPNFSLSIDFPLESKLAYVDFEYLALTLVYLIEVLINACNMDHLCLSASEKEDHLQVIIRELTVEAEVLVQRIFPLEFSPEKSTIADSESAETYLKLELVKDLLLLQEIEVILSKQSQEVKAIKLNIPILH